MDEKQNRDNQSGYDRDTFGQAGGSSYHQDGYNYSQKFGGQQDMSGRGGSGQNQYRQTPPDGGSFYHSSEPPRSNGFGIASMVLGIISLVLFCTCLNIPLAVTAIIFGIIHISRGEGSTGFSIAGIVTSVISVILTAVLIAVLYIAGARYTAWMYTFPFEEFMDDGYYDGDDFYDYDNDYYGDLNDELQF